MVSSAPGGLAVIDRRAAAQDDQRRQGTDHNGIGKYFKDAEHALLDRLFGVSAGMGNGAGAKARFVGKYSAGNTFLHAQEQAAHCARR